MNKIIMSFMLIFFASAANSHHNDQDYVCEDQTIVTPYYQGWASCTAYNSSNQSFWLQEYVPATPLQQVQLWNTNFTASCFAFVPFSHNVTTTQQVCTHTPKQPYVSYANYEYASCNFYTRDGFIIWESKPTATTYQLQEKSGTNWINIYTGPSIGVNYAKQPGPNNKSYTLRVRAKNSSQTGSWNQFNVQVPGCWNGGGAIPR